MKRVLLIVVAAVIVAAIIGSFTGNDSSETPAGSDTTNSSPSGKIPHRPIPVARSVCAGWSTFTVKMNQYTPKDQIDLVPYAISVGRAAQRDVNKIPRSEFLAAENVVAWVGSSDFTENGNVDSPQYRRMVDFCGL